MITYLQERGVATRMSCCVWRFEHEMTYVWRGMVCHAFMTCDLCQQVMRVKHKLGERFTRQEKTASMLGGL